MLASDEEIADGSKLLRIECKSNPHEIVCLMCYDFNLHTGCAYRFISRAAAREWGRAIGLKKAFLYDKRDDFSSEIDVMEL